jgi:hypothetical protein
VKHFSNLLIPMVSFFFLAMPGCGQTSRSSETAEPLVRRAVREAKAQGLTAISTHIILDEDGSESTLDTLTSDASVLLISTVRSPATASWRDEFIFTWHQLKVEEILWTAQDRGAQCDRLPPSPISVTEDEIALKITGGSVHVGGITVTLNTDVSDLAFVPRKRYLLMAVVCPGRVAYLEQGLFNVFEIDTEGRIDTRLASNFPFVMQMRGLGSVDGVRRYFSEKQER